MAVAADLTMCFYCIPALKHLFFQSDEEILFKGEKKELREMLSEKRRGGKEWRMMNTWTGSPLSLISKGGI